MTPRSRGSRRASARGHSLVSTHAFYRRTLVELNAARIPYMVGGAFAFARYTGIERDTRDFDVFVLAEDARRVLQAFKDLGYLTRLVHPHWLGKIYRDRRYVDVIFGSGNGLANVDAEWFEHARRARVYGMNVRLCPIEEMIWSKSFIMERERFDGADVLHLVHTAGRRLDWPRLLRRFGSLWRVLLAHVVLYDFVYPGDPGAIPIAIRRELLRRAATHERDAADVCRGTLLSRSQYEPDVQQGLRDGRLFHRTMGKEDIAHWTAAAARNRATKGNLKP